MSSSCTRTFANKYAQTSTSLPSPVKDQDARLPRAVPTLPPPSQPTRPAIQNDSRESRSASPDSRQEGLSAEEPEYDPDEEYGPSVQADLPEFPITHELILKDHTKVVSALALDPSGARVLSGSHDYDCKLWDFGGMDQRCKPFKSWEPAESYHVSFCDAALFRTLSC
jgi:WD repeat-containing protein 70